MNVQQTLNGWLYPMDEEVQLSVMLQEILDGTRLLPDAEAIRSSVKKFDTSNYIQQFLKEVQKYIPS